MLFQKGRVHIMENMQNTDTADLPQHTITKALIEKHICGTDKKRKPYAIAFAFSCFFGVLGAILLIVPPLGILFLGLAAFFFILGKKNKQFFCEIQDLNYWLLEDVCLGKSKEDDPDHGPYTYEYLHLDCRGKVELHFPDVHGLWRPSRSWDLYDATHYGDTVYLLCSSQNKILYIFHGGYWQIDKNDFVCKENNGHPYYLPVKQKML